MKKVGLEMQKGKVVLYISNFINTQADRTPLNGKFGIQYLKYDKNTFCGKNLGFGL